MHQAYGHINRNLRHGRELLITIDAFDMHLAGFPEHSPLDILDSTDTPTLEWPKGNTRAFNIPFLNPSHRRLNLEYHLTS